MHLQTCQKLCCTFQYWPWCTVHCAMTTSLWTLPLGRAAIAQSNIGFMLALTEPSIVVGEMARQKFSSKSQHQPSSTI
jgi:hypothetical protein